MVPAMDATTVPTGRHKSTMHTGSLENTLPKGRLVTKIHDKWYDLTDFEKLHPGGPVALGLAASRDGTVMFESHHPFTHRKILDAILEKYELSETQSEAYLTLEEQHGIPEHPFIWKSEFGEALRFQVREYFEIEAKRRGVSIREATKATPSRWLEIAIMAVIFLYATVGFVRGEWISLFLFPLSVWVVGVNTFHDAAHFSLHSNWRVNAFVPYVWPHFSSPFTWYHQHNIGHHSYPNIADRDPDLLHHYWMKREHRSVEWVPEHEKQRSVGFMVFWWSVAVEFGMTTMEDAWMLIYNVYNETVPMKQISKARLALHIFGRVATIVGVHSWPFLVFDTWAKCFAFAIIPYLWFSVLFMMNTQINHLTPTAVHAEDKDWFKHQVVTAQDFGVTSKFCFIFSGGLNYQIVHHLFPTVNHCHLPKLQPIVARLCEKYSVDYKDVSGYIAAIKAHHDHTVNMSYNQDLKIE